MNEIEKNYEDFISTVSHELRTPLTSIRGFSQTLLTSWDKIDDESKKKFIKIIEDQSNRLIHLVENMLSVTKLQSSNNKFVFEEFNVVKPIDEVIAIVKNNYPNHIFEFDCRKDLPNIFADKDRFTQIMTNLIENSAKYSIGDNKTQVKAKAYDNSVIIEISNLSIPINKQEQERIFTKFSRIDNPLTRKVQGSGLGLFITKNLVEKMSGEIEVNSEKNTNSEYDKITFSVKFPILNIEQQARMKCKQ